MPFFTQTLKTYTYVGGKTYDELDFDRDSWEWYNLVHNLPPFAYSSEPESLKQSKEMYYLDKYGDDGSESESEEETFVLDTEGMTERDLDMELSASAHGFCCMFCRQFHCPATDNEHVPADY